MIDGLTNSVITTITVGDEPLAFASNPVQNRTYVANVFSSSVSVLRDATGIEEDQKHEVARTMVQIFPNPAKTSFTICTVAGVQGVKLYDVLGKLLRVEDMSKSENGNTMSVKNLSAGVYFLIVNTEDSEFIRKVVVTK